ncbi:MAG: DMT family transporter [Euryarchaeota archaeon]|nr:DMT family transporter [Euryarchaeota archaeon]
MMKERAYLYAFGAVLAWSTVATAFKISLRYVDYLHLLFYASLTSSIVLFIILFAQGKLTLLRRYSKRQYLHSLLLSALNPFLYYLILFKAYSLLPAQVAQPLNCTWPVILVLLSIPLLGQKIGLREILAILISFSGVVIIGTRGDLTALKISEPFGVALALGSSVIWSLFWIANLRDERDEVAKLFLNFSFTFVFVLISIVLFSEIRVPHINGLIGVAYVGIFEMGITFVLWLKALKLSETTATVSNLIFLFPFISLIFIHLILGEEILPSTIAGLFLIVTGILIQRYRRTAPQ